MGDGKYILDGQHRVIREDDLFTWAIWLETADRLVRQDGDEATGWVVSTIFLGLDYRHVGDGPPLVFETMVFAPGSRRTPPAEGALVTTDAFKQKWDGHGARYSTWDEAEAGHQRIIEEIGRDLAIERGLTYGE